MPNLTSAIAASSSSSSHVSHESKAAHPSVQPKSLKSLVTQKLSSITSNDPKYLQQFPIQWVVDIGTFKNLGPERLKTAMAVLGYWGQRSQNTKDFFKDIARDTIPRPGSVAFLYQHAKSQGNQDALRALKDWGFRAPIMKTKDLQRYTKLHNEIRKAEPSKSQGFSNLQTRSFEALTAESFSAKPEIADSVPPPFFVDTGLFDDISNDSKIHRVLYLLNSWGEQELPMKNDEGYISPLPASCFLLAQYAERWKERYPHALEQLQRWGMTKLPCPDEMLQALSRGEGGPYMGLSQQRTMWRLLEYGANPSQTLQSRRGSTYQLFATHSTYAVPCQIRGLLSYGTSLKRKLVQDAILAMAFDLGDCMPLPPAKVIQRSTDVIQDLIKTTGLSLLSEQEEGEDGEYGDPNLMHRLISLMAGQVFRGSRRMSKNPLGVLLLISRLDPKGEILKQVNEDGLTPLEWGYDCDGQSRNGRYKFDGDMWEIYGDFRRHLRDKDIKKVLSTPFKDLKLEDFPRELADDIVRIERALTPGAYPDVLLPEDVENAGDED